MVVLFFLEFKNNLKFRIEKLFLIGRFAFKFNLSSEIFNAGQHLFLHNILLNP